TPPHGNALRGPWGWGSREVDFKTRIARHPATRRGSMRRLNHFLLAAVVLPACSSFAAPGVTGVAQAEPLMRLAQAPSPEELKKKKEQQQQPRPGGPPPGAQPSRPPGPPAQAPAAPPAQRPVQSAPPPAAPHPAQVPPPQPPRPTTQ